MVNLYSDSISPKSAGMLKCESCGNEYDKAFQVIMNSEAHVFDSFECAIQVLAPQCGACGNRIIGHGVEVLGSMYCCAHCAKSMEHAEVRDRI